MIQDTGHNLNVHKTFRRCLGRLLNVLCTFNLRPLPKGISVTVSLTFNLSRSDPGRREKIDLNFYFQTSLWCLRTTVFIKPFEAPQRSVKIKFKSIFILIQLSEMHGAGTVTCKHLVFWYTVCGLFYLF